jgi:hypothetical protein
MMFWCQRDIETSDVPADLLTSSVCWCNVAFENPTEADRLEDLGTVAYRGGVQIPHPEIPKALQNCAKLNPICENC